MSLVKEYTNTSFKAINKSFRERVPSEKAINTLKEMESLPSQVFPYLARGTKTKHLLSEIEGNVWSPRGIVSTSSSIQVARKFAIHHNENCFASSQGEASLIIMLGAVGKDLSLYTSFSKESEVVLLNPSLRIKFLRNTDEYKIWIASNLIFRDEEIDYLFK
ncbi:hypothetical protein H6G33_09625 [Calothrix sp. FACHB-1219]|uniref:hypothetical protein n=1 Tax=unclassified Calothrix TaxID=2619626 RepID=UPI0016874784|nr:MULTISPECIES: hypothetical protein [unclassified Calothrix]MBD2201606.1 hypothetical protein [Calothrix sp. FACHB-168]MBD2217292.1 hypothetical protein [Calothrix sp. FACHB-1219]